MTKIIAFAGRKQSGKTTCANAVEHVFNEMFGSDLARIYNFADPLKQDICMNILGLTHAQCYGSDEEKNNLVDCYWDNKQLTAREVMQFVGTDIFRKMQTNVWANATLIRIEKENPPLAIIADCRFPNEVDAIKKAGGFVIKLTRNPYSSDHASETALDPDKYSQSNFDTIIMNHNMDIPEQIRCVLKFLKKKGTFTL
jgi:hypothetical protein